MRRSSTGTRLGVAVVVVGLASSAGAVGPNYALYNCTTTRGTFKVNGNLDGLTCTSGHCTFGPFTYQKNAPQGCTGTVYTDADIFLSGYDWNTGSSTVELAKWHLRVQKLSWNQATQTLTYNVVMEAENLPGQGLDQHLLRLRFQIVGTTGAFSQIHRFTQTCEAKSSPSCTTTGRYTITPTSWLYVGHAMSQMSLASSGSVTIKELAADSSVYNYNPPPDNRLQLTTGCTMDGTGTDNTSCTIGVIGLSANVDEAQELENYVGEMSVLNSQSRHVGGFQFFPPAPYPRSHLCGLQKLNVAFDTDSYRIWAFSGGAKFFDDCEVSAGATQWTGQWTLFLGDQFASDTNQYDSFTGSCRLWGAKLK